MSDTQDDTPPVRTKRNLGMFVAFKTGQSVMVQVPLENQRYWGRVIGSEPYEFFILTMPVVPGITRLAAPGATLTLRMENEGEVFGFSCKVISTTLKPQPLLILSYPTTTERLQLRRHRRIKCLIPSRLENDSFRSSVFIVDISRGGCKLIMEVFKDKSVNLMVGDRVDLGVVLDSTSDFQCRATVVSNVEAGYARFIGASFDPDDAANQKILNAFMDRLEIIDSLVEQHL